jgi:hypothetical protein
MPLLNEACIERKVAVWAKQKLGVVSVKLTTPGETGYPDRLFLIPGGKPLLIEFKRPGEQLRSKQAHIHDLLKKLGYEVQTHDNFESAFQAVSGALVATRLPAQGR